MTVTIDRTWRTVYVAGVEKPLTRTEFDFVLLLLSRPGYVSHEAIHEALHPGEWVAKKQTTEETKVLAHRVRRKLGEDVILLCRGYGYGLRPGAITEAVYPDPVSTAEWRAAMEEKR